jgi:hypothetical protein
VQQRDFDPLGAEIGNPEVEDRGGRAAVSAFRLAHVFGKSGLHRKKIMLSLSERTLLGFLDLDLGAMEVRVPVRAAAPGVDVAAQSEVVSLECDGSTCEIIVHADPSSEEVGDRIREVARQALRHLSQKLLN